MLEIHILIDAHIHIETVPRFPSSLKIFEISTGIDADASKERLRRVILTASWFIAINVGQFFPENSLRFPWRILIFS